MLEIIMMELSNLGCVPRLDGGKLMISNSSRIDQTLRDAIKEHRDSIIEFLGGRSERAAQDDLDEVDPVDCDKCGGLCTVEGFNRWKCQKCDDLEASAALTRRWIIAKKTIEKKAKLI